MDTAALLRAMDLNCWELYREIARTGRGNQVLDGDGWTMIWGPRAAAFHNAVMVRAPIAASALLDAVYAFYAPRGGPHSIWLRAHADRALEGPLHARGYAPFTTMPGMALLADPGTRCEPPGLTIAPCIDDAGRDAYRHVAAEAYATYGAPRDYAADAFSQLESVCAPHVQGFVGYVGGEPVAAAALYLTHGVAGIGWVGCVPAARGRRYAEAVTWAAVREGFRRGARFANLQASPMGRPVYQRMGFRSLTEYRVLVRNS